MFKKHNSYTFFLILLSMLISSKSVYSEGYVSWYSQADRGIHRISVLNGDHVVFYENHTDTLPEFKINFPIEGLRLSVRGHLFPIGNRLMAVYSGSGAVFNVDTLNKEVNRLDRTLYAGYNFDAYSFHRRDTIFSFGGYGFWVENNLLTYYSEVRKEWSVYSAGSFPPYNPDYTNERSYKFAFYDRTVDELFVLRQTEFYSFNFKTNEWNSLGRLKLEDLFPERKSFANAMTHRLNDSAVMFFSGQRTYYVTPKLNLVQDVTLPNGLNTNGQRTQNIFGFDCGYDLENEILITKFSDKLPQGYLWEFVNRIPRKYNSESALYDRVFLSTQAKLNISLFGFLLLGGFLTFKIRNRYLKKRSQYYSEEQWKFIQAIDKKALSTDELNVILNLNDSSWEVQRRRRSEFIKNMNELSMNQLGCELVERRRSSEDKRQVVYTMNADAKSKLARLM